jgi:hypothetical protein
MAGSPSALRPPHPLPEAGHGGVASSLFCSKRDPHGLSHPFQEAKLLGKLAECIKEESHGKSVQAAGSG